MGPSLVWTCQVVALRKRLFEELTIEPHTPFGKMNLDMPGDAEMADMYVAIGENLKLPRYEVSTV